MEDDLVDVHAIARQAVQEVHTMEVPRDQASSMETEGQPKTQEEEELEVRDGRPAEEMEGQQRQIEEAKSHEEETVQEEGLAVENPPQCPKRTKKQKKAQQKKIRIARRFIEVRRQIRMSVGVPNAALKNTLYGKKLCGEDAAKNQQSSDGDEDLDLQTFSFQKREMPGHRRDVEEVVPAAEKEKGETSESDPEDHHGNAIGSFIRFRNVRIHVLKKAVPGRRMRKDCKGQILREWKFMSDEQKQVYIDGSNSERENRKKEGKLARRTKNELQEAEKKKLAKKKAAKAAKKGKAPQRCQSYMSLPSIMILFEKMSAEQKQWINEIGLGGWSI